jgi:hypothetical protein
MRPTTVITAASLLALCVALTIGAFVLRSEVETLGRDTAGIRAQTAGARADSGSKLRDSFKAAAAADLKIRSSFVDPNNISKVLEDIEAAGRERGVATDIRSVNKTGAAVSVAISLEGSKESIVAMVEEFQSLPVSELANFYLTFSTSGQKSGWGAALTLTFPTP